MLLGDRGHIDDTHTTGNLWSIVIVVPGGRGEAAGERLGILMFSSPEFYKKLQVFRFSYGPVPSASP